MEEVWKVSCFDNDEEEWSKEVRLSEQEMRILLQMLLCRKLEPHEIIESVTGERPNLLTVSSGETGNLWTPGPNLSHYTAEKMRQP